MQITDIISKNDLSEPYDRLSDFLTLDEIIRLEQEYGGRQMKFKKSCQDIEKEYPELTIMLGRTKALRVMKMLGGVWTYFPELKRSCLDKIKGLIISEFDGYNYLQLAKKYGYTDRHIRRMLDGKGKRPKIDENQLSLFD